MQSRVDEFVTKSRADGFQLNESKCKELRISFTKSEHTLEPVTINNEVIPSASSKYRVLKQFYYKPLPIACLFITYINDLILNNFS